MSQCRPFSMVPHAWFFSIILEAPSFLGGTGLMKKRKLAASPTPSPFKIMYRRG
jgi:hypothetical protein